MTELGEINFLFRIYVTGIRIHFQIIFAVNHKYKNEAYIANGDVEVNKPLHKSLIMLPVIILNKFFSILKIFALHEEFRHYINP